MWKSETSLEVQWLRVYASNAEGMGSIPGWAAKISHAVWYSPNFFLIKKMWESEKFYIYIYKS